MANEKKLVEGKWEVTESQSFSSLTIADGASIVAPEGKYVTLTLDGTTHTIQPGSYEGDVKITVSDNYTRRSLRFGEETISNFHAGAIVKDGTILQLMDNDDVGMCPDPFLVPIGEVDVRDDRDLTQAIEEEDIFVSIKNMTADGDFLNSTTNLYACMRRLPRPEGFVEPPTPPGAEKLRGFIGKTLMGAKNLDVRIENATVNGNISAANAAYGEGITRIDHDSCDELSNITQTPAPAINNGVIVTVGKGGIWKPTATCYLTKLEIRDGGQIHAASMTVDGKESPIAEGLYTGQIVITLA